MVKNKIDIVKGDITQFEGDAIVNAANNELQDGAGVNGAIHRKAGPLLSKACLALNGCATGQAKITPGYELPVKYIIHTVGPVWRGGARGEAKLLASCYTASLKLAVLHEIKTLAFPAISCGIYGYPSSQAAIIAVKETANFLEQHDKIEKVTFVCFDDTLIEAYQNALNSLYHE
jgi:O-acetyl-ADP-ribose deacetylase (regulator of RNase III)